jgi:hypothetical protein
MAESLNIESLIDQVRQSLQGTAKNAVQKLWGKEGPPWGTTFDNLEELAAQIGQLVSREVLQQALAAQAQTPAPPPAFVCPCCGRPTVPKKDPELHPTRTAFGEIAWSEPATTCGHCRKAFFPSVEVPGH